MINPTKTMRRLTSQQKQEAVELWLQEGLSCNTVAQRLVLLTSEERAELNWLRKENRELRGEKDFFRLAAAHLP